MVYATLLSEEDLSRFRTKQCKRLLNGGCNFGLDRCQYSHNEFWNRRCPFYLSDSSFIRYITVMCPDVETRGDGSINSLCLRGGECPFAHSTEEILYHPLFYKTKRCEDYKKGSCNTYYCPFIHGLAETRVPGTYKLPFTNGIDIPNIPNVIIVDKIDICSKNSSGIINDKYMKNMSFKKRSDNIIQLDHMNNDDMHYCNNKTNSMNSAIYDSMDTISNKNDMTKNAVDKSNLSFNNSVFNKDSFFNFSEENIKMNMLKKNGAFEHMNNNTYSRNSMKDSINSFGSFEANNMGNNNMGNSKGNISGVIGNMKNDNIKNDNIKNDNIKNDNMRSDNIKNDNIKNDNIKNDNIKNENIKNENTKNENMKNDSMNGSINGKGGNNNPNKNNSNNNNNIKSNDNENNDNNNKMNRQSNCSNVNSCNYNEFLSSKLNGAVCGSYQNMCSKNISLSTNNSTNYIDTISTPNKNYNKNLNILKLKQNHSSCSTDAHEINFNEHEATSEDAIEEEEDDEYFNSENIDLSVSNRNNELERISSDTKLSNVTVETNLNIDRNNEINLLEVIKCLKGLCEKIMKGDLTFTSEQWDNIAQITYEIVAVIEFNRVMKLKKTANKIKNDIYNKNKDFIFHMENKEYKKERNDTEMEKELYTNDKDKIEKTVCTNIDNLVEEQNSNINGLSLDAKLKNYDEIFERPKNEKGNDINTLKYSLNENIYIEKDKINSVNKDNSILFLENDENNNNMLNKFNFNFNKREEHIFNNLNELIHNEDNELVHFYEEQLGENFLDEKNDLDIMSMKQKFIPSQINKTNIINDSNDTHALQSLKDSCFLEYYNINKSNNLNFKDKNDNNEKLSSQQPFVSFFSFLSE
ncbi:hypothetical protein PFUGPA_04220 [Plasmodium falciparum Palo Alto/Uganda]|uniref:C3H1-type domain-containing protein n=5 Tax=Plasmodium falciparum TaxID=5833 RepID=A0A024VYM4_PLAFA|nr:D13 [Plasmodium falciparum]AAO72746.1 D13 [Plasmodium falciparum]ETW33350.1 hypothetical protein PFTANZ_05931 [Plasmodium falciparum Tanzania (2000708)]ETW54351.1 hypothetical protein PFUGPA_04220 [Plasmodium falciparum Palo Alto/Uganda]ETW58674.1 hypothetical protein PFMC_05771 [Plasmodium falciparum CAMP/Malaysia]